MTSHDHDRAIDLITRRGTDDFPAAELNWLESHLEGCAGCAEFAQDLEDTGRLLRATAVTATPALVASTQARVRARAMYLREQHTRTILIAISFCLGAISSALSAWLWWRFGSWAAEHLGLSRAIVEPGIAVFLLMPTIVIAVLMLAFPHAILDSPFLTAVATEREGVEQ